MSDFAAAAARKDWNAAYALMSASYQRRVSIDQFRAQLGAEPEAVAADAAALSRADVRATHAQLDLARGDRISVILEDAAWRLETPPIDPFAQDSPRAALRTFVRAVDSRRYDVLLRLSPRRYRDRINKDTLRAYWEGPDRQAHRHLLERLRAHLSAPIVDLGTEAVMPFGDRTRSPADEEGEVRFVFEDGLWKVDEAG